ncbi:MAG: NAD kinase [Bacteroidales bacterium]|jgi:NAD+ kinase|nr:NAD kinase [Bacteroidales bacterium]
MNIAIYGRNFGNNFIGLAIQLFEELKNNNTKIYINNNFNEFLKNKFLLYFPNVIIYEQELPKDEKIDFLLSIGGDGTFLESATIVGDSEIPILGINTGRLGFLAYVNSKNFVNSIKQLLNGNFTIDKRMMLEIEAEPNFYGNKNFCLNEFAIQKKSRLSMIKTKIFADDCLINTYWSDGVIVATPTGSTAYSLSCGGPIVVPHSDVFLITPIANHNLTVRPLIISAQTELKIVVESHIDNILLSMDYRSFDLICSKEIKIRKAKFYINFVNLFENNYFCTLSEKLYWGLDLRN